MKYFFQKHENSTPEYKSTSIKNTIFFVILLLKQTCFSLPLRYTRIGYS